mmetsp:Transcript_19712/g.54154  ORF Transcript_19712/g.54154 Transcript_19712/m.54154 type:complete len:290 (-) Transcript_19712:93-962(-)
MRQPIMVCVVEPMKRLKVYAVAVLVELVGSAAESGLHLLCGGVCAHAEQFQGLLEGSPRVGQNHVLSLPRGDVRHRPDRLAPEVLHEPLRNGHDRLSPSTCSKLHDRELHEISHRLVATVAPELTHAICNLRKEILSVLQLSVHGMKVRKLSVYRALSQKAHNSRRFLESPLLPHALFFLRLSGDIGPNRRRLGRAQNSLIPHVVEVVRAKLLRDALDELLNLGNLEVPDPRLDTVRVELHIGPRRPRRGERPRSRERLLLALVPCALMLRRAAPQHEDTDTECHEAKA